MIKSKNDKFHMVEKFLINRGVFIEFFIVTVMIALGISIIANYLFALNTFKKINMFYCGIVMLLMSIILLFRTKFKSLKNNIKYTSFFIYDKNNKELLPVFKYNICTEISRILKSAFAENKALLALWTKEPLEEIKILGSECENSSRELFIEAIEYYLLDILSTHLTNYFNNRNVETEIIEYERNDIPSVLLSNRFLELFSRNINDREVFLKNHNKDFRSYKIVSVAEDGKETVEAVYHGDALYKRFNLMLPRKSKIVRINKNTIQIDTPKVVIKFQIDFQGYNTVIPKSFKQFYLQQDSNAETVEYMANINIMVNLKSISLLSLKGWEYHSWVDSFLETLNEKIDKNTFFETIQWNQLEALLYTLRKRKSPKYKLPENIIDETAASVECNNNDDYEDNNLLVE